MVDPHVARPCLRGQICLRGKEFGQIGGCQRLPVGEHQRGHHLVADPVVGDRVHRHLGDRGKPLQHPFDRCGSQVLTVDAQPVRGAAGQIDPPVGVAVGQVPRPVHAVAHPLAGGGRVVVVTRERT